MERTDEHRIHFQSLMVMAMKRLLVWCGLLASPFVALPSRGSGAEAVDYVRDVLPIFQTYCIGCHAADDDQGGLEMESFDRLMLGGESGLAITPGSPASSRLLMMASGKLEPKMPPDDAEGPNEAELARIAAWIEQGAKGPKGQEPMTQRLRSPSIPTVEGVIQPVTAIAATVNGKLMATGRYGEISITSKQGQVLRTIAVDAGKVNSLQFSRDGSRLLVGTGTTGASGAAMIYSIESGELITEFIGHRDSVFKAVFSPDESLVATGGYDRDVLLWNVVTGEAIREFTGHNGAITDLAFSPEGRVLVSSSSDETIKVWGVESGKRLDTLSQSEGEVLSVDITADGRFVLAGSADNRLRVWRLLSVDKPRINPLIATRFMDESPIVRVELTPDGTAVVVLSEAGHVKIVRTSDWQQVAAVESLEDTPSDACVVVGEASDPPQLVVSMMNGKLGSRSLPKIESSHVQAGGAIAAVYMDLGVLESLDEAKSRESITAPAEAVVVPRGVVVSGSIGAPGEVDKYQFAARAGEVWAIDADAKESGRIDPVITVLDESGNSVLRTRLQAVRDSYFTFRGKNSMQSDDFRLFAWEEMNLDDYLYASGEVTRLWMRPRGPDSGFNVYPGTGERWTYFGTSHVVHALGEPAYVVRPLAMNEEPTTNGLPVFDLYYENDDDPARLAGKNSRLLFTAPADAMYTVAITDTRREGASDGYGYQLKIRAAEPGFNATVTTISKPIRRGSGRECVVRVQRQDGFDGEVSFEIADLPAGLHSTFPVVIESGQQEAIASVWADADCKSLEGDIEPMITATAMVHGVRVERRVGTLGKLTLVDALQATPRIIPADAALAGSNSGTPWTLQIARGETASARVTVVREAGFENEIGFGKEFAGRGTAHGVYVDNIGLNGLLLLAGQNEREFFITADAIAEPGQRLFFLQAEIDGGVTTPPIVVEVLP